MQLNTIPAHAPVLLFPRSPDHSSPEFQFTVVLLFPIARSINRLHSCWSGMNEPQVRVACVHGMHVWPQHAADVPIDHYQPPSDPCNRSMTGHIIYASVRIHEARENFRNSQNIRALYHRALYVSTGTRCRWHWHWHWHYTGAGTGTGTGSGSSHTQSTSSEAACTDPMHTDRGTGVACYVMG